MGTVLGVLLSLIASTILSVIFNFLGGILGLGIYRTTGIVWLPVVIMVAMSGAAMFGGLVLALRLVRSADPGKTFFGVAVVTCVFTGMLIMAQMVKKDTHMIKDIMLSVLTLFSIIVGAKAASVFARDDCG